MSKCLTMLVWLSAVTLSAAQPSAPGAIEGVLHLVNDGFVGGSLQPDDNSQRLRWQSPLFATTFEFSFDCVRSVQFPSRADEPQAKGDCRLELAGGDVLQGTLRGLDADEVQLETHDLGLLRVRRSQVRLIQRREQDLAAPDATATGLAAWQVLPGNSWREESGHVIAEAPATLEGDFKLPVRASIDLELSWKRRADFAVALGVGPHAESVNQAFRIEAFDSTLMLLRELSNKADVAHLRRLPGEGRIHLQVLLDQEAGRCVVISEQGKQLAEMVLPQDFPRVWPRVRLVNKRGDLRLEQIRVARWSGVAPQERPPDHARLHLLDGTIVQGEVVRLDATAGELLLRTDGGQERLPLGRIDRILLPHANSGTPSLRAERHDGLRFSGELIKVDEAAVWLDCESLHDPLRLPLASLRSLTVLSHDAASFAERVKQDVASAGRTAGMLEAQGVRLRGRLIDCRAEPPASCLAWQPFGTQTSSPLLASASGRIVFQWQPAPPPNAISAQERARRRIDELEAVRQRLLDRIQPMEERRVAGLEGRLFAQPGEQPVPAPQSGNVPAPSNAPASGGPHAIYLRTGDTIPCEVIGMDEHGVSLKTGVLNTTYVKNEAIQAVELQRDPPVTITKHKRDRLLTLPRMQRDSPPTHLIRARDGDYLRGRLVAMDDQLLRVEVRLEIKELPRERISRILMLHDDARASEAPADERPQAMRVQGVQSDGSRVTLLAEQLSGTTLSGQHSVIGPCQVDLGRMGQLLFGSAIDESASRLVYQQWKLQPALEPFAQPDESADASEGAQSNLVGKPAADFELPLLTGTQFRLSGNRDKIVVIEFWTTWCGVCLQTMPQLARVADRFADRNVQVVAVNLEETPEAVTSMLQRHNLQIPIALDRNGAVAAKYGVSTLPQVLIIDAEGVVFRHFIGGGPRLGDQLEESLQALLARTRSAN